jgi:hypothetical protein
MSSKLTKPVNKTGQYFIDSGAGPQRVGFRNQTHIPQDSTKM